MNPIAGSIGERTRYGAIVVVGKALGVGVVSEGSSVVPAGVWRRPLLCVKNEKGSSVVWGMVGLGSSFLVMLLVVLVVDAI